VETDRAAAAERCARLRKAGLVVVFTNGCFDILHAGHIHLLEKARAFGDFLVVGLNTDSSVTLLKGPGRPVMPLSSRALCIASLRQVDMVVPFDEPTPADLIRVLEPAVLVKGGDYEASRIAGADFVVSSGGRVEIVELLEGYSTSSTLERVYGSR
jgi:D-beta-D-heptose 7-phosphate kinase/D-beta-D-heptose 1-phosphate adenosyltransferase